MGRPQFENQVMISAVSSKKIRVLEQEYTNPLTHNMYQRITILSPKNTMSKLFNCMLHFAPITEGVSGLKYLIIDSQISSTAGIGMFKAEGNHNADMLYDQGHFKAANSFEPNDLGAISNQINAVKFDDVLGMQVIYRHTALASDGAFASTIAKRRLVLFLEEEVVKR